MADNTPKNDDEKQEQQWRENLSEEEYRICRQCGTEPAFTGEYWNTKTPGVYLCKCCSTPLFDSTTKFDSGSGWPSFYQPVEGDKIEELVDRTYGMVRTEIRCQQCGSHLGHVFPDGPPPTGLRYCVNSASLSLQPNSEAE
ncbi:peptide-methionine (R)-S-oxide reductase MsrB [Halioxenophilus sp. WMMB6]|uniref:peptide-methionine (R)-S-oxide reductase MsrB n=1 Tax=Halioxenophilus sp. WMMB6 TaxID=3073815 RepID=UPI00295E5EE7|nr:peptide-methionine (R)-S-oxide reductase MsrB [Halioxenophilus sp. WMMB6]